MTPEARKVIRDAKRAMLHCKRIHAELNDRIARLQQMDLVAASARNAGQLNRLLEIMQSAAPANDDPHLPKAA